MFKCSAQTIAIVLTATVDPDANLPNLAIRDPGERLSEYLRSFKWWSSFARRHNFHMFIFENSDNSTKFAHLQSSLISVVPVRVQEARMISKGKGAGEAAILSQAADRLKEYSLVLKTTGRLRVLNAEDLIRRHVSEPSVETMISWDPSLSKVDTRCFTVRPSFLGTWMAAIADQVSDDAGFDLESQSARWLMTQILNGQQVRDFARTPSIVGRSASEGVFYSERKARARAAVESVVRGRLRTDPRQRI